MPCDQRVIHHSSEVNPNGPSARADPVHGREKGRTSAACYVQDYRALRDLRQFDEAKSVVGKEPRTNLIVRRRGPVENGGGSGLLVVCL